MYKEVKLTDSELIKKYKNYKLCYIDEIDETIWKYESNDDSPFYSQLYEVSNPDYKKGESEYYAYFTPRNILEQVGDDWDDSPYEHNAGIPYDTITLETRESESYPGIYVVSKSKEITIVKVPFSTRSFNTKLPQDYGYGGNSYFCVDDINRGAVAWIYDYVDKKTAVAIPGGCTLQKFVKLINQIVENNKEHYYIEEDD